MPVPSSSICNPIFASVLLAIIPTLTTVSLCLPLDKQSFDLDTRATGAQPARSELFYDIGKK